MLNVALLHRRTFLRQCSIQLALGLCVNLAMQQAGSLQI